MTSTAPTGRTRRRGRRRTITRMLVLTLFAALVLTACGGADEGFGFGFGTTSDGAGPAPTAEFDMAESAPMDREVAAADPDIMPPTPDAPTGRHVIRSAEVSIRASDTSEALAGILGIAQRVGGYAATTDLSRDADGVVSGWVTLRVPADRLDQVVRSIEDLADSVPSSRTDEYDVTMEMVDLEARLDNLTRFEQELLDLLSEVRESSPDAEQLLQVFERIRQVRQEIDQLEARRTALRDQVEMATVHVGVQQTRTAADVSWIAQDSVRDAFAQTVRLLTGVADGFIWLVVTGLPVALAVLALPLLIIWLAVRRTRRRRVVATTPPPPPGAPPSSVG